MYIMRLWKIIIIIFVIAILGAGVYSLRSEGKKLEAEVGELTAILNELDRENEELRNNIKYFEEPENLLKELKSQFNYKERGEELIIIIPGQ